MLKNSSHFLFLLRPWIRQLTQEMLDPGRTLEISYHWYGQYTYTYTYTYTYIIIIIHIHIPHTKEVGGVLGGRTGFFSCWKICFFLCWVWPWNFEFVGVLGSPGKNWFFFMLRMCCVLQDLVAGGRTGFFLCCGGRLGRTGFFLCWAPWPSARPLNSPQHKKKPVLPKARFAARIFHEFTKNWFFLCCAGFRNVAAWVVAAPWDHEDISTQRQQCFQTSLSGRPHSNFHGTGNPGHHLEDVLWAPFGVKCSWNG